MTAEAPRSPEENESQFEMGERVYVAMPRSKPITPLDKNLWEPRIGIFQGIVQKNKPTNLVERFKSIFESTEVQVLLEGSKESIKVADWQVGKLSHQD